MCVHELTLPSGHSGITQNLSTQIRPCACSQHHILEHASTFPPESPLTGPFFRGPSPGRCLVLLAVDD